MSREICHENSLPMVAILEMFYMGGRIKKLIRSIVSPVLNNYNNCVPVIMWPVDTRVNSMKHFARFQRFLSGYNLIEIQFTQIQIFKTFK